MATPRNTFAATVSLESLTTAEFTTCSVVVYLLPRQRLSNWRTKNASELCSPRSAVLYFKYMGPV